MKKIFDASDGCPFTGRSIIFDTNVWFAIDGGDPRPETAAYSTFFKQAKDAGNTIVTNDYIIGEFFNRSCRIQYDIEFPEKEISFKKARKSAQFQSCMESIRDTCLNILSDCTLDCAYHTSLDLDAIICEASAGLMDLTDLVIRERSLEMNYVVVSDDGDFARCGLELVTANQWLLSRKGR